MYLARHAYPRSLLPLLLLLSQIPFALGQGHLQHNDKRQQQGIQNGGLGLFRGRPISNHIMGEGLEAEPAESVLPGIGSGSGTSNGPGGVSGDSRPGSNAGTIDVGAGTEDRSGNEFGRDPAGGTRITPVAGLNPASQELARKSGIKVVEAKTCGGTVAGNMESLWSVDAIFVPKQLTTGICIGSGGYHMDVLCSGTPVRQDLYQGALDNLMKYIAYWQSKNGEDGRSLWLQDLNLQHFCEYDEAKYGRNRTKAEGECVDVNFRPFVTEMGSMGFSSVDALSNIIDMLKGMQPKEKPLSCNIGIRNKKEFVGNVVALGCIVTADATKYSQEDTEPPVCPTIE